MWVAQFEQKGRCSMKSFWIWMVGVSLVGLCLLSGLGSSPAYADFKFGKATNLGAAVNSSAVEMLPVLSPDGLELYFFSYRPSGYGDDDVWVTSRASTANPWSPSVNLGPSANRGGLPS